MVTFLIVVVTTIKKSNHIIKQEHVKVEIKSKIED